MPTQKVLIWAKTYPELSTKYKETVCTAGCTEDGKPIRLYPLSLRYLPQQGRFKLYSWVEADIMPSTQDTRPESHKVVGNIRVGETIDTKNEWRSRKDIIYADTSWHYDCLEDLKAKRKESHDSLGFIKVSQIEKIWIKYKKEAEIKNHWEKLQQLKSQLHLFSPEIKNLEPQGFKIYVKWYCPRRDGDNPCPGHTAGIMDWGLGELGRREGPEMALRRMQDLANLERYDLAFFVGNFAAHPQNFGIIGLWYPLHPKPAPVRRQPPAQQPSLF